MICLGLLRYAPVSGVFGGLALLVTPPIRMAWQLLRVLSDPKGCAASKALLLW
jgi:hypothetical protein